MSGEKASMLKVGVSLEELVKALQEMDEEDREWFVENLVAATSPEYLKSIEEAGQDYREGRAVSVAPEQAK
ncbi:MAG TPA: hypothetical protein VI789_07280 [Dehalococcoidia bacterium]|nr:hypothetical protein [Dehalococcoidia bacterium]